MSVTKEEIIDRISELLIEHFKIFSDAGKSISEYQKVVRDGIIQKAGDGTPRTSDERIVLYASDLKANLEDEDLIEHIHRTYFVENDYNVEDIQLSVQPDTSGQNAFFKLLIGSTIIDFSDTGLGLTNIIFQDNISQFIDFIEESPTQIDPDKAHQILDTNIFELLPTVTTRQQRINEFFTEYNELKPPSPRQFGAIVDEDNDGLTETQDLDLSTEFSEKYDISHALTSEESSKNITWLVSNEDNDNANKSLEWLHNDLSQNYFLQEDVSVEPEDERPEYRSRSDGYLKIRHANQAIIVRNEEGDDIGLIGQDPNNPIWQTNGLTIAIWVRFLDKISSGTLFNFGNPTRSESPMGFRLETFLANRIDYNEAEILAFNNAGFFINTDVERFIRLAVREQGGLRDSHVGSELLSRLNTSGSLAYEQDPRQAINYTHIPMNLNEWYFIVANYNPSIDEDGSDLNSIYPDYWRWNCEDPNCNTFTSYSGYGARCKVEIISRSDLLRARGFKVKDGRNEQIRRFKSAYNFATPEDLLIQ